MFPVELDQEIIDGVYKSIPQINDIKDGELRDKCAKAWAFALQINGYRHIEDMPGAAMPEATAKGDQSMHIRVVARLALHVYDDLCEAYQTDFGLDRDLLIACGLMHDVGKPYEFSPENRERWGKDTKVAGLPAIRHPAYGVYIGFCAELPEEVIHVIANHSPEGRFVTRSAYGTIVHFADDAANFSLGRLCDLNIPVL